MIHRGRLFFLRVAGFVACATMWSSTLVAGEIHLTAEGQWWSGDYGFQSATTTYALDAGLRYQSERFSMAVTVPLVFQNSNLVGVSGGMLMPRGGGAGSVSPAPGPRHGMGGMSGDAVSSPSFQSGVGDVLVLGSYRIADEGDGLPSVGMTGQVKVPTASMTFGTGEWDYGAGVSLKKQFRTFGVFADAGYLVIGDPAGVLYRDPLTVGVGIGQLFLDGKLSTMVYFQAYTKVLDNYDAPRQLSLGILYGSSQSTTVGIIGSFGLSNATAAAGVSMAVEVAL